MKIIHRFSVAAKDSESRAVLASLGIRLKEQPLIMTFEVQESDARWPAVDAWSKRHQRLGITRTVFSSAEIAGASWLALQAAWHHGYPQPDEDEFGYRKATYDLTDWCPACGTGMRQVGPFQMKGEPTWGRNSILQLNWVFDEYFVTPQLWQSVFRPCGVAMRPVVVPGGRELLTVVQLVVEQMAAVVTAGLPAARCANCGRLKYLPVTRGFFPPLAADPDVSMVKSAEYFGSGASAFKAVLVSADIAKALRQANVNGASLIPVARASCPMRS
jgi:hypothetical protein